VSLIEIERDPSPRDLAWFGVLFLAFAGIVGALARWRFHAPSVALGIWCGAVVLVALYYAIPSLRRPCFVAWSLVTYPIGWLVSHVVLAVVYYLVVTPIGVFVRVTGRVHVRAPFDADAESYWIERRAEDDPQRYLRQF
jgi:hypothetical protein